MRLRLFQFPFLPQVVEAPLHVRNSWTASPSPPRRGQDDGPVERSLPYLNVQGTSAPRKQGLTIGPVLVSQVLFLTYLVRESLSHPRTAHPHAPERKSTPTLPFAHPLTRPSLAPLVPVHLQIAPWWYTFTSGLLNTGLFCLPCPRYIRRWPPSPSPRQNDSPHQQLGYSDHLCIHSRTQLTLYSTTISDYSHTSGPIHTHPLTTISIFY